MKPNLTGLEWYLTRSNHGYGRFTPEAKRLINSGYLQIVRLSRYAWILTITDKGRNALASSVAPDKQPGYMPDPCSLGSRDGTPYVL